MLAPARDECGAGADEPAEKRAGEQVGGEMTDTVNAGKTDRSGRDPEDRHGTGHSCAGGNREGHPTGGMR